MPHSLNESQNNASPTHPGGGASTREVRHFWQGELAQEKLDFCDDWLRKRAIIAARIFFGFSIVFHILAPLFVWLWLDPLDLMVPRIYMFHGFGLVLSLALVVIFDRGLRRAEIIFGATQFYFNAGSILLVVFDVLYSRPEINVLQAYMVSTAVSFVSLVTSPYSRPWVTGVIFAQNVVMMSAACYFDEPAGFGVALWYVFFSGMGWLIQTKIVVKSIREAMQEFESRKILARLARLHLDQELDLARHIEESFLPPPNQEIGLFSVECFRDRSTHIGGHWFALRDDGAGGLFALMCDAKDRGVRGALILHAVQSLWAEDLVKPTFDPEAWLQKTNRALFVLGKSEIHELQVSLVHVSGSTLTHWGGGNRGVFQIGENQAGVQVLRPLAAGELILGLGEHIFPVAATFTLDQKDRVFICNRAAFPGAERKSWREVIKLHDEMRLLAAVATSRETDEVGRTLLVISRRTSAGRVIRLKQA